MRTVASRRRAVWLRSASGHDRGVAALIVGVSLFAVMGAVGLAVDLGNHRATETRVTTAADSAALAAAQGLNAGDSESDACTAAQGQVAINQPSSTLLSCSVGTASSGASIVTVEVTEDVEYLFAQAVGFGSGTVTVRTAARYGPLGVTGARPFGICMEALAPLLVGWDSTGTSAIGPVTVPYGKGAQTEACNGGDSVPGNWGSLDFDGGSNSNADQSDWIENGYSGAVYPDEPIDGNTGAVSNSVSGAMDALILSGEVFPVPLFGSMSGGSGSNAEFNIIGFVDAQLTGYDVTGSADSRTLQLVFHPGERPGVPCCDINGASVSVTATGICATSDDTDAC